MFWYFFWPFHDKMMKQCIGPWWWKMMKIMYNCEDLYSLKCLPRSHEIFKWYKLYIVRKITQWSKTYLLTPSSNLEVKRVKTVFEVRTEVWSDRTNLRGKKDLHQIFIRLDQNDALLVWSTKVDVVNLGQHCSFCTINRK